MSLFATILDLLKSRESRGEAMSEKEREALRQAWGMDENDPVEEAVETHREATDPTGTTYDQQMWRKKVIRTVSDPAEIGQDNFFAHLAEIWKESHALGISPEAIFETAQTAFRGAVRHVVTDREITTGEHLYLEELKETLGLPNEIATRITHEVVQEAEAIFEEKIKGA